MNIFVIHSGNDRTNVLQKVAAIEAMNDETKNDIKANVCLMNYEKAKAGSGKKRLWKRTARKLIKNAQLVLYIVSADGSKSKNIDWEIRQAKKQSKAIVIWNEGDYDLNDPLTEKDSFTKKSAVKCKQIKKVEELTQIINDYESGKYIHLFNGDECDLGTLFEQYKLFSDTSESLVTRRQNVNSFYITANTALITIGATVFAFDVSLVTRSIITMALSFPGFLLNISWLKVLDSYSLINSSKMKILGMLEKRLSASLFNAEWEAMENQYNKKKYVSFSDRERQLPIIFNWVFGVLDVVCAMIIAATLLSKLKG